MIMFLSFGFYAQQSIAANTNSNSSEIVSKTSPKKLILRLNEITKMDKSNIKSADKRNLRKEVRSIKRQLKENGDGFYISIGGAIIILLLLIILL